MPGRSVSRAVRLVAAVAVLAALAAGCSSTARPTSSAHASSGTTRSLSPARTLEQQYVAVVKTVARAVVQIQTDQGLGSGVVFDGAGDIVTNAHVIANAGSLRVTLADGRRYDARLVGAYAPDDLAVISIGRGRAVTAATFADSSKVEVGDIVLAAGNPLGLQSSITDGIVSATGRTVSEGQGVVLPNAIQTSAAINPGNSDGALVDLDGRVIVIPTLAAVNPQSGAAAGIGFAIPSNVVRDIAGQIVAHGRVVDSHRAALGVSLADNLASPGAIVAAVAAGGPAATAGIAAGDSIEAIAGKSISSADDVATVLATLSVGQKVKVTFTSQDGTRSAVTVTLGQLAAS